MTAKNYHFCPDISDMTKIMYLRKFILIFIIVTSTAADESTTDISSQKPVFTAVFPKIIFPYSLYNISVSIEDGAADTSITATITSSTSDTKSYSSKQISIFGGTTTIMSLPVQDLEEDYYTVTIKSDTDGVKFEDSATIGRGQKLISVHLQTDKSIYKPGERVQFRIIVLDEWLKPLAEDYPVQIRILDSRSNLIKVWKILNITHGFYSSDIKLSEEPNLGNWAIEVENSDFEQIDSIRFLVTKYVAPKFKVVVKLPSYLTTKAPSFRAEIMAFYTNGKPVEGNCTVTLRRGPRIFKNDMRTMTINGNTSVEFDFTKTDFPGDTFEVEAAIQDLATGWKQVGSNAIRLRRNVYEINLLKGKAHYQPGLPFILKFQVTENGIPLEDFSPEALSLFHSVSSSYDDHYEYHKNITQNSPVSKSIIKSNGIASFSLTIPLNETQSSKMLAVRYRNVTQFYQIYRKRSPFEIGIGGLGLETETDKPVEGAEVELYVTSTDNLKYFNYIIYRKNVILTSGKILLTTPQNEHTFKLRLPVTSAGSVVLLVYSALELTNEIIADSIEFKVTKSPSVLNKLQINLSEDTVQPGDNVTISIQTAPRSLVALRGVDESVLILMDTRGAEITTESVEQKLLNLVDNGNNGKVPQIHEGSKAFQAFQRRGLLVLTNGVLEGNRWTPPTQPPLTQVISALLDLPSAGTTKAGTKKISTAQRSDTTTSNSLRIRHHFPETWLWEELWTSDANGTLILNRTVPDTLTSWLISGYSLNSELGLGFSSKPQVLKTFRPFFISLDLPYSVVLGETLSLEVQVHNYMDQEIQASISLLNENMEFEFKNGGNGSGTKEVTVGPSKILTVIFEITPRKLGTVILNVTGTFNGGGDAVSQSLRVKAPGLKQVKTESIFVNIPADSKTNVYYNLTTNLPAKRVEGATSVRLSISSGYLGSIIPNLQQLLNMPFGCGEQNMLQFVVGTNILDYLTTSGLELKYPAEKLKIIQLLEDIYQRELTFRRKDGSFALFSGSTRGSTMLTAYVVKSFLTAKSYITIDDGVISKGLEFLAKQQLPDGGFNETGQCYRILTTDTEYSAPTQAAYVLLTFIEASSDKNFGKIGEYTTLINKGLDYIAKTGNTSDTLAVTLITYTLQMANHSKKEAFFDVLKSMAITIGDEIHWERILRWLGETTTIEVTSYALLTYLNRGLANDSLSIVNWLMKQRNAAGGFMSTQDTVVGLTALIKYAGIVGSPNTQLEVIAETEPGVTKTIIFNEENWMIPEELVLPPETTHVRLAASGQGNALAQVTWTYYVNNENLDPGFSVNVTKIMGRNRIQLDICVSYLAGKTSNMAIVQVNLPSGFIFVSPDLTGFSRMIPEIKRHDLVDGDTKLITYFDSIYETSACFIVTALKQFKVGGHSKAKAYVVAYDYYDPTKTGTAFYNV